MSRKCVPITRVFFKITISWVGPITTHPLPCILKTNQYQLRWNQLFWFFILVSWNNGITILSLLFSPEKFQVKLMDIQVHNVGKVLSYHYWLLVHNYYFDYYSPYNNARWSFCLYSTCVLLVVLRLLIGGVKTLQLFEWKPVLIIMISQQASVENCHDKYDIIGVLHLVLALVLICLFPRLWFCRDTIQFSCGCWTQWWVVSQQ